MKKFLLLLFLIGTAAAPAFALPKTPAMEVDHDPFGIWKRSRSFESVKQDGAHVVLLPKEQNFFAYWKPPEFRSGRIMVGVHGTGGNPYEELKDEIPVARDNDYMFVAVQWYVREKGGFLKADDLYRLILEALSYVQQQTGNDLSKVAYIGFSRGAAISYEVAHLDAASNKIFDLIIAHSGGVPKDFRVEAKNLDSQPDVFFRQLAEGDLGPEGMKGTRFFLYSGDKDESWGLRMSEQVEYAASLIKKNGGEVVEYVRDPEGGHMGFRKNRAINQKAVDYFIRLSSGG